MTKYITIAFYLWLVSSCCSSRKIATSTRDSINVSTKIEYIERLRDTTIYIEVAKEIEKIITKDTISKLKNKFAKSTASVSEGFLKHCLETIAQKVEKEIQIKEVVRLRDTIIYKESKSVDTVVVYQQRLWQKILCYIGVFALLYFGFKIRRLIKWI